MKAVLISIQPKWCELIASSKKTVEVRKTKPKLETPFKVYIYCTNWKDNTYWKNHYKDKLGKVIGEFVCDRIAPIAMTFDGLVDVVDLKTSCLSVKEMITYSGGKLPLYGWHISDLVIYDTPKELSEFRKPEMPTGLRYENDTITKPPQSWCYVERSDNNAE